MSIAISNERLIKSGFWVSFLRFSESLIRIVKIAVLTHLLTPDDFGIFGIALLTMSIVVTFTTTGFKQALIQKSENIETYLNTAWTTTLARRLFSAIIIFSIAPLAASFFDTPEAAPVIRAISGILVVQGFINVADVYLQKELNFKLYFKYQFLGTVVEFVATLVPAYFYGGVWPLVFGIFMAALAKCIASYVIFSFRPRLEFKWKKFMALFDYGKWVLGSSILVFVSRSFDNLLVGKYLGPSSLGLYQVAFKISYRPAKEIIAIMSTVLFPYFSNIQEDLKKVREYFSWTMNITFLVAAMINTGIIFLAADFANLVLKDDWNSIIDIIQYLAIACFFSSCRGASYSLFRGKGYPKFVTYIELVKVASMIASIFPLMNSYGLAGIALSVVLSEICGFLFWLFFLNKVVERPMQLIRGPVLISMAGAATMISIILGVGGLFPNPSGITLLIAFLVKGILGMAGFLGMTYILYQVFLPEFNYMIVIRRLIKSLPRKYMVWISQDEEILD